MRLDVKFAIERIKNMDIKINKAELSRRYNCDVRTVDKYIKLDNQAFGPITKRTSKLDEFTSIIEDKVDNCAATAMAIYKFILARGYAGKYGLVKNYVKKYKQDNNKKATIRFESAPGQQSQVDWKEKKKMINKQGEIFEVNIFLYILGYSRVKYIEITEDRKQSTLLKCMINAFEYTGGVPNEILFDNMRTVVDRSSSNFGNVKINSKFGQFAKDCNFKPVTCKPYRPQTKGKVEALAKLVNRLDVYNYEFETIDDLKNIAIAIMKELNHEISQATNSMPVDRYKKESEHLLPFPNKQILNTYAVQSTKYKISKESMLTYMGNKYSVPTFLIGKEVQLKLSPNKNKLYIYYSDNLITSHYISNKFLNYHKEHMIEIYKSDVFKYKSLEELEELASENLKFLDDIL